MTTDLMMLVWTALLCLSIPMIYVINELIQVVQVAPTSSSS